jgi:hypothetical protein
MRHTQSRLREGLQPDHIPVGVQSLPILQMAGVVSVS